MNETDNISVTYEKFSPWLLIIQNDMDQNRDGILDFY